MNTNELEDAIRAELRAEVRQAPSGAPTKAAVLQAIRELPAPEQQVRRLGRWTVPLLAAAAVVLVAIGLTIGARSLTSSRPTHRNQPANQQTQTLTPPPPNHVDCSAARGETLVNGLQTSYTVSATGERRYVFEYYCAGSDGHRTGSSVQIFKMVNGSLQFLVQAVRPETGSVVMSLSGGGEDGFRDREADLITSQLPFYGAVGDGATLIDGDNGDANGISVTGGGGPLVAQACRSTDLTVQLASAQLPTPHLVLQLTNHSKVVCALWGNPHYTPLTADGTAGRQPVHYLLRGPAGGVTTAPAAPVLVLQPGAIAGARIATGSTPSGCAETAAVRIVMPDGVALGEQPLRACDITSYPLVLRAGGDDAADYSTAPKPSGPSGCGNDLEFGSHPVSTHSGDGAGLVLTVKLVSGPACTLSGYPDVYAVDSSNAVLATAGHTPRGTLGGLAADTSTPPTITLTTGQTASALVEWAAAAYTPTSTCQRNARVKLVISSAGAAYGATYDPAISQLCDPTVHPWVAGTTGSQ